MANGHSFKDGVYDQIEAGLERKYNLPTGGMKAIRTRGERSNADQVSEVGARTVYQIMPGTRSLFAKKYGVDAYSSKEGAAEVAALHLRDSMKRNGGDWNAAVAEYHGGPDRRQWGPRTRAYGQRVTGADLGPSTASPADPVKLQPGVNINNISTDDILNTAPNQLNNERIPLQRKVKGPKTADLVTDKLIGGRNLNVARPSDAADYSADKALEKAAVTETAIDASFTFGDRVKAAVDKNWVLNQIVRGMDRDVQFEDPKFHAAYVNNMDEIEAFAQTPEERNRMRNSTSMAELEWTKKDIERARITDRIINSNGTGGYFEVGSALLDPVGIVTTAGVGKVGQLAGKAYTLGRAAVEGAAVNIAFTGALDISGQDQTLGDYAISGTVGLALGAALHRVTLPSGRADDSVSAAARDLQTAIKTDTDEALAQARTNLGPDAAPDEVVNETKRIATAKYRSQMEMSLADVGDENKFLTAEEDLIMTSDPKVRQQQISKSGLDVIDDAGYRAMLAEVTYRAERIVTNNPIDEAGLQGRFLKSIGDGRNESTGLTLLRSKSPVMQAFSMQVLEGTTGAGGRRRTAAISQVTRERLYLRPMIEYEQMFNQWRKAEGKGFIESYMSQDARREFDRAVYLEIDARKGLAEGSATSNRAVARVADQVERGMGLMAAEQRHVGTLGSLRLPATSRGYLPQLIDARKVSTLTVEDERVVEGILAKQFNTLNEYSYIDKATGEKITKNFDPAFSRELARRYITHSKRRAMGSYDIPVNIHDSGSAEVIESALEGMQGVAEAEREAILGKFSRGGASYTKGRLKLDMSAPISNGRVLGDLFRQDIMGLYRGYARRASGEVALAQYGIYGKKGLDVLREAGRATGATGPELEAFDQTAAEMLNMPYGNAKRHPWLDNVRIATSAARLGGMGFTQLGEAANGIIAVGAGRVMSSIGGMKKMSAEVAALARGETVDNGVLNSIDTLGGHLGMDDYQMTRMFDLPDTEVQLYNDQTVGVLGRSIRAGSHLTSVMSGHRRLVAVQTRGMAEQIVRKAIQHIKDGTASRALLDMGFTPEIQSALRKELPTIAKFDAKGKLTSLDLMAGDIDPNLVMSFRDSVERGAGQIIQKTFIGETGAWAHNDLAKTLLQFRTFSITSIEKQWGRNVKTYGTVQAFATIMGAMSFALPIHYARLQAQMIGMPEDKRAEFAEKRMSGMALARATLNYASGAGLLGDFMDLGASGLSAGGILDEDQAAPFTGGGQGRQSASGLVPGLGMIDDVLKGTVGGQYEKLPKLLPGSNLPFVTPLVNGLSSD